MNEIKNNSINFIINKLNEYSARNHDISPDMFISVEEFYDYAHSIFHYVDPHLSGYPNTPTKNRTIYRLTDNKYNYIYINHNEFTKHLIRLYWQILNVSRKEAPKYVIDLLSVNSIDLTLIHLFPFMSDGKYDIGGYIIEKTKNYIYHANKYTGDEIKDNIDIEPIKYDELVFIGNATNAYIISKLFPKCKIYVHAELPIINQIPMTYNGMQYSIKLIQQKIPSNIIFTSPPKRYWPFGKSD